MACKNYVFFSFNFYNSFWGEGAFGVWLSSLQLRSAVCRQTGMEMENEQAIGCGHLEERRSKSECCACRTATLSSLVLRTVLDI